jgi:hypothetical protein
MIFRSIGQKKSARMTSRTRSFELGFYFSSLIVLLAPIPHMPNTGKRLACLRAAQKRRRTEVAVWSSGSDGAVGGHNDFQNRVAFGSGGHDHRLPDFRACLRHGSVLLKGQSHASSRATMTVPYCISEDQCDMRGIKPGWYEGELSSGPFSSHEECLSRTTQPTNGSTPSMLRSPPI